MQVIINGITPVSVETYADGSPITVKTEYISVEFTLKKDDLILQGEAKLTGDVDDIDLSIRSLRKKVMDYIKTSL